MDLKDFIKPEDLGEPYSSLIDILSLEEICQIEHNFNGRQINFKKSVKDVSNEYPKLVLILGAEKTVQIVQKLNGQIYFPELKKTCRDKIKNCIRTQFNGYNYADLAARFGYSERTIRRIIKNKPSRKRKAKEIVKKKRNKKVKDFDNQITLFDHYDACI